MRYWLERHEIGFLEAVDQSGTTQRLVGGDVGTAMDLSSTPQSFGFLPYLREANALCAEGAAVSVMRAANRGLRLARTARSLHGEMSFLGFLAAASFELERHVEAIDHVEAAVQIAKKINDWSNQCRLAALNASIFGRVGLADEADAHRIRAIDLSAIARAPLIKARVSDFFAQDYLEVGDVQNAKRYSDAALKISEYSQAWQGRAVILLTAARVAAVERRFEDASQLLRKPPLDAVSKLPKRLELLANATRAIVTIQSTVPAAAAHQLRRLTNQIALLRPPGVANDWTLWCTEALISVGRTAEAFALLCDYRTLKSSTVRDQFQRERRQIGQLASVQAAAAAVPALRNSILNLELKVLELKLQGHDVGAVLPDSTLASAAPVGLRAVVGRLQAALPLVHKAYAVVRLDLPVVVDTKTTSDEVVMSIRKNYRGPMTPIKATPTCMYFVLPGLGARRLPRFIDLLRGSTRHDYGPRSELATSRLNVVLVAGNSRCSALQVLAKLELMTSKLASWEVASPRIARIRSPRSKISSGRLTQQAATRPNTVEIAVGNNQAQFRRAVSAIAPALDPARNQARVAVPLKQANA